MFWGCITYYGVGTLVAIDGNMNTDKYISVLDDNLWPVVQNGDVINILTEIFKVTFHAKKVIFLP
jgi:hypothetical protein